MKQKVLDYYILSILFFKYIHGITQYLMWLHLNLFSLTPKYLSLERIHNLREIKFCIFN